VTPVPETDYTEEYADPSPSNAVPFDQQFTSESFQHKTQLYYTRVRADLLEELEAKPFTRRFKSACSMFIREAFDPYHILSMNADLELPGVEMDLMIDRLLLSARKSDRRNPQFMVYLDGLRHVWGAMSTRSKGGWEAGQQHKVTVNSEQRQTVEHIMPKQKRGLFQFGD